MATCCGVDIVAIFIYPSALLTLRLRLEPCPPFLTHHVALPYGKRVQGEGTTWTKAGRQQEKLVQDMGAAIDIMAVSYSHTMKFSRWGEPPEHSQGPVCANPIHVPTLQTESWAGLSLPHAKQSRFSYGMNPNHTRQDRFGFGLCRSFGVQDLRCKMVYGSRWGV